MINYTSIISSTISGRKTQVQKPCNSFIWWYRKSVRIHCYILSKNIYFIVTFTNSYSSRSIFNYIAIYKRKHSIKLCLRLILQINQSITCFCSSQVYCYVVIKLISNQKMKFCIPSIYCIRKNYIKKCK
ncbi:MAG: hypothetical protein BWY04_00831 [candidate division CPR1 bacterium ADurb.Bin160]|uniref:Uncharacterized protein n=1 Tax=candidate division CPR1 bacterium ADurb.Bin160 TaxID=1852826 RepID=A0A1V5ZMF0_9BACT|nr:MAG: hypothetical protein BWY04_00831 [candidate division CPR1 bacterium ADurb.Bin160]